MTSRATPPVAPSEEERTGARLLVNRIVVWLAKFSNASDEPSDWLAQALATARSSARSAALEEAASECDEAAAEYDAAGKELARELDDRVLKRECNLATSAKRQSCQRLAERIRALKETRG